MAKQKIVLKLQLDSEKKRRKAFKAAVGMAGVTSATLEGEKIIVVGDGVDPIALTTMLRRNLGYAELLTVSSGDDKKKQDSYGYGYGYYGGGGGGGGGKDGKDGGSKDKQPVPVAPIPYPPAAYQQYNAMPASYPVYSYPAANYQQQEEDPAGCSIM